MATNAAFLSAIQGMTVTGVTRHYDEPPASVTTTDLPCLFPMLPGGGLGEKLISCWSSNKTRTIDVVILIAPVMQGTQALNYAKLAPQMDYFETALDGLEKSQGGSLANFVEYEIASEIVRLGDVDYWGIVARVDVRDI